MIILNPAIEPEKRIDSQNCTALQSSVVEEVLRKAKFNSSNAYRRSNAMQYRRASSFVWYQCAVKI